MTIKFLLIYNTTSCKGIFFKIVVNITNGNDAPYNWPAPKLTNILFVARIMLVPQVSFKVV